jgi:DNA polymerase elongation subunit (family B)
MILGGEKLSKISKEGLPMANPPEKKWGYSKKGDNLEPFRPSEESVPWLKKFCLEDFDCLPEMEMVERFGHLEKSFKIFGRVHLDYLELYRKFTFEELHSYTLDAILKREVNQSKVQIDMPLDQLYRQKFRTFIAYNRQDVAGLDAMDTELKMIELANTMAHMAGVTFDKVFGSVAIIEQAVLRELHRQGKVYFDKNVDDREHIAVPGAFVVEPHKGLYEWVASFDINSLYPSVIRALNISPECVIGQFKPIATDARLERYYAQGMEHTEAWAQFTGTLEYHSIMDETDDMVTFVVEGVDDDEEDEDEGTGEAEIVATGKQWKEQLRTCGWSLSANGTVFDLEREGIVPFCLTKWYAQRQEWQAEKKKRKAAIEAGAEGDELIKLKSEEKYYDMIQLVMKIFLNSTYGALLNRFCRFYDPRLGKSVTLTGRLITKHMIKYSSELMTGNYEFDRNALIYGDTDSVYCTLDWYMGQQKIEKTVANAVKIADDLGVKINESFPTFMDENCMVGLKRGAVIQAGREAVARRGLFKDVKKRYALYMVDYEGYTPKPGKEMKIMGMEVRRSDTPKFIQEFLTEAIEALVRENKSHEEIYEMVSDFRDVFQAMDPWRRGTPCRVSSLTSGAKKIRNYEQARAEGDVDTKKPKPHFSVTAANNTNILMEHYNEHRWDIIRDGDKIEVLYLRPNELEVKSVAIKVGENFVPDWFKALPFDDFRHEAKLIDKKLDNMIGSVMDWTFEPVRDYQDVIFEEVDFFAD